MSKDADISANRPDGNFRVEKEYVSSDKKTYGSLKMKALCLGKVQSCVLDQAVHIVTTAL